jgi:hypothetical protein
MRATVCQHYYGESKAHFIYLFSSGLLCEPDESFLTKITGYTRT